MPIVGALVLRNKVGLGVRRTTCGSCSAMRRYALGLGNVRSGMDSRLVQRYFKHWDERHGMDNGMADCMI